MKSTVTTVFKSVVFLVILAGLAVGGYAAYKKIPPIIDRFAPPKEARSVPAGQKVIVNVPKGSSLSQIGTILERKGVISSRLVFKIVAMIRGEQRNVQAGEYELVTGSDAGDVLDQLISGKTLMIPLTIPEGYNIFQIADKFEAAGIMSRAEFLKKAQDPKLIKSLGIEGESLEGYLFPDTYHLRRSDMEDGEKVIRIMVDRFREVYDKEVGPVAEKFGWTPKQVVTLASLIEKEARAEEHADVSAVFHNRIRKKMLLQSDPTVIYGIKPMGSKITRKDLENPHPYNTYRNRGLPPGPIANPGKASLVAAVKPSSNNYLYFVSKNDGTHKFSPTLKEHNRAVNQYQRGGRSSGP